MPVNPETSHVDQIQAAIASNGAAKSALIASWRRSSTLHRLDPTETRSPERVSDSELAKVRQEIDYNGARLDKILKDPKFKKYFSKFWDEDKLKTMPKGYPKDHPHIEWLKLKSFIVIHTLTDQQILDKKLIKNLADMMRAAKPLNDFLREANA